MINWSYVEQLILGIGRVYCTIDGKAVFDDNNAMDEQLFAELRGWTR